MGPGSPGEGPTWAYRKKLRLKVVLAVRGSWWARGVVLGLTGTETGIETGTRQKSFAS